VIELAATNNTGDDFARRLVTVRASENGNAVTWKLPDRLIRSPEANWVILDELMAEFREQFPT
jgi:hypothetical protein